MKPRDSALAFLVMLIWGFNFVVISWGLGDDLSPFLFAAMRFVLVIFPAILFVPRPNVPFRQFAQVGIFMSLGQFAFVYAAIHAGLPAGLASVVLQAQVLFTILLAAVVLRERPGAAQLIGVGIGMVGLVIVGVGRSSATPILGLVLCLAGAVSWAIGNVVARRIGAPSGLSMTVWSATVVPVPLFILALLFDGPAEIGDQISNLSWQALASTAFTACLASLVGYSIFNSMLARYPASTVIPFTLIVPAAGITSAWIFLDEVPNGYELAGSIVLVAGVATTLIRGGLIRGGLIRRVRTPRPVEPSGPAGHLPPLRTGR